MSLSLTFTWVIGDAVTINRNSTAAVVTALSVDVNNNKVYTVSYTDPTTNQAQRAQFLESELH